MGEEGNALWLILTRRGRNSHMAELVETVIMQLAVKQSLHFTVLSRLGPLGSVIIFTWRGSMSLTTLPATGDVIRAVFVRSTVVHNMHFHLKWPLLVSTCSGQKKSHGAKPKQRASWVGVSVSLIDLMVSFSLSWFNIIQIKKSVINIHMFCDLVDHKIYLYASWKIRRVGFSGALIVLSIGSFVLNSVLIFTMLHYMLETFLKSKCKTFCCLTWNARINVVPNLDRWNCSSVPELWPLKKLC